ncbi:MAG: hypothetical protein QNJ91_05745 [Gammaproteobacteria bacterium]|nr:hypothetical protein [Gammaproteobacteria bacterium]
MTEKSAADTLLNSSAPSAPPPKAIRPTTVRSSGIQKREVSAPSGS